jgi:putative hydrolase of the HAD superfamily
MAMQRRNDLGRRSTRAVLFDFGGTLFSYSPMRSHFDRLIAESAREHGLEVPADRLREAWARAMLETAVGYTARDFYLHRELFGEAFERFLRAVGGTPKDDSGLRFYHAQTALAESLATPRHDAAETLAALRARGVHVGIVSNIDDDQFGAIWSRMGLDPHVDAITTSEAARSCKPHGGIYRVALEKAGGPEPEEALFVGDSLPHDVTGANAVGLRSVLLSKSPPAVTGGGAPAHVIAALRELLALVDA